MHDHTDDSRSINPSDVDQPAASAALTTSSPAAPSAIPVAESERLTSVDVLRGFAVLGILVMNINAFGWPMMTMFNPTSAGGFTGLDLLAYKFEALLFSQKFMTIFSMLFGAGLILMTQRAEAAGRLLRSVYFRRLIWLILFGIVHAYFLWEGDILFFYGCCGLWLWMFRHLAARWLVVIGIVVLSFGVVTQLAMGVGLDFYRSQAMQAEEDLKAGKELEPGQKQMYDGWQETRRNFEMPPEYLSEVLANYKGDYFDALIARAPGVLSMHTLGFFFMIGWRVLGLMLIGMGLMKIGFFSARLSFWTYGITAVVGYGVGLPISYYGLQVIIESNYDIIFYFQQGGHYDYFASVLISLGHMSLIMLVCKANIFGAFQRGMAAVGRTAFSNYILHSVVMTTVFYGYGFNLYGEVSRFPLLGFVLAMWVVNIALSVWWLKSHRYGPLEWLWRRLTYGKAPQIATIPQTAQAQPL